jgi:hypothetical protein
LYCTALFVRALSTVRYGVCTYRWLPVVPFEHGREFGALRRRRGEEEDDDDEEEGRGKEECIEI